MSRSGRREPIFNAPWPAVLVAVALPALYYMQARLVGPDPRAQDLFFHAYGLVPADVDRGRWVGLVTSLFLHGGWPHVLLNAIGALAFGTPVARLLGLSPARGLAFFAFYLVCGVVAGWVFAVVHPDSTVPLIGASGAVSALMGAAARLLERRGRLGPILTRTTVGMGAAWIVANVIVGLVGWAPGAGGAMVGWEVHIAGFLIGLLLIGPWAALFGRRWRSPALDFDETAEGAPR